MWYSQKNNVDSYAQYFVSSGAETSYSGYQQAWRMLGIYVDCSNYIAATSSSNNNDNHNSNNQGCQRYLVWAAYVDLNYQGDAIGEYAYYNLDSKLYDDSICNATESKRCAKMDCHDSKSTTWSLMGIYKEPYYGSEWFEQLFKHFGYCVWDENEYSFMSSNYENWPEKCVQSNVYHPVTNSPFYIDLKPGPNLTLAVYTDAVCFNEYIPSTDESLPEGTTPVDTDSVIQSSGYLTSDYLRAFNDAMMSFKICQPCPAFNINNADDEYACDDAAGYTNVNQCMKFRTKTTMMFMTPKDIHVAFVQGAITDIQFYHIPINSTMMWTSSDNVYESSYQSIYFQPSMNDPSSQTMKMSQGGVNALLVFSILLLIGTFYYCYKVIVWILRKNGTLRKFFNIRRNRVNQDNAMMNTMEKAIDTH
jgi:hypothetical protein